MVVHAERNITDALVVFPSNAVASFVRFLILKDDVVVHLAGESRLQVAEFVAEEYASLRHRFECQRVVVVRCNVPVERHLHIHAERRAHAESRSQETGLALGTYRETEIRRGKNRNTADI